MNNDYDTIYEQFEKNFKEEASSFITQDSIANILELEKIRFDNAKKYNIPIKKIAGSSIARYAKDMLRRCQPLFFVYYILSMLSELSYYLLIWSVVKCSYLYFTGIREAFSTQISLPLSLVFFTVIVVCSAITQSYTRNILFKCTKSNIKNIKSKISVFNAICYFLSAFIIVITALWIYINPEKASVVKFSLFEVFIFTVAMLSISGVHNVIYSSHFVPFITTGYAFILNKSSEIDSAILHYRELSLTSFLIARHLTVQEYEKSVHLQTEFNQWLRQKVITFRAYGAIAFFIIAILTVISLRQLITTGLSAGLIIFTAIAVIITLFMLLEIISCNCILKTCTIKQPRA